MAVVEEQAVLKILDANLDRAREGVRVVEEWLRFGGGPGASLAECKALRQQLGRFHTDRLRAARDTPHDPGTGLDHPDEGVRSSTLDVVRVNFARIQEALRVLEEYAKLAEPDLAAAAKAWRYRVYTLESVATGSDLRTRLAAARLYLVTSPHPDLVEIVERSLAAGLPLVQLREKEAPARDVLDIALRLRDVTLRHGALLIVNDRVDLALACGADGVHLGQEDLPLARARALMGPRLLIGQSTHAPAEAQQAVAGGADYLGVGPVYATPTKEGRTPVGLAYVRYCREHSERPGFAIGGIDRSNLEAVIAAGAERVAVVRAIMAAEDPGRTTAWFLERLNRG
ncbi:thiamine phosphate synthase [Gloeobacter morelensis]|uniref:Thiamine-phosphate synthase n=1 Tax=Gloeobacter morelensis MG652769 TaxID=2781736 RepID=A0ABY3PK40_9CYAN|nr:thiamine phosphate synthase [Gloeobacter morelensis MG652769]